jgi:hypothetical protein
LQVLRQRFRSSADTAPAALMEEALTSSNVQQEEEDETQIQYVEPKRKKKIRVYPG